MLCKILIINMLDYKFKRFIFNTMLKRRSCITGITYSISLNINTMQHTHALTSTPNTDHPVLMRLPI